MASPPGGAWPLLIKRTPLVCVATPTRRFPQVRRSSEGNFPRFCPFSERHRDAVYAFGLCSVNPAVHCCVSMSLADQLWSPTSVQVTVLQARGLKIKGKGGTNDAFAVMQVGKEKYQTTVAEKSVAPAWKEEATFDLPGGGGGTERSTLRVHVLHRALVGPDKLLGQAVINLAQLNQDKSRSKTE